MGSLLRRIQEDLNAVNRSIRSTLTLIEERGVKVEVIQKKTEQLVEFSERTRRLAQARNSSICTRVSNMLLSLLANLCYCIDDDDE